MDSELYVKLRREFADLDDSFDEPDVENFGSYGDFQLVGHGTVTNEKCGKFRSFYGCLRTDLHNRIRLDGKNFKGKVYVRKVFHSCDKPSCPVCYKYGWAVRQAGKIEVRLAEASKRFGLVEHIVASVPVRDYGLSHEALRRKVDKILFVRGIIGGAKIFHGFRYNLRKQWYWSPHWHILGFVLGGFSQCRHCGITPNIEGCRGCGGFEDRTRKAYATDGYIVRVLGKRETVGGTAWYQLNHASIKVGVRRFHVATYFGVCSYRKLKIKAEDKKNVCPICLHDLEKLRYFGNKDDVWACFGSDVNSCKKRDFFTDLEEDGRAVWVEKVEKQYGSGDYEE